MAFSTTDTFIPAWLHAVHTVNGSEIIATSSGGGKPTDKRVVLKFSLAVDCLAAKTTSQLATAAVAAAVQMTKNK